MAGALDSTVILRPDEQQWGEGSSDERSCRDRSLAETGIQGVAISADGRYIVVGFQDSVIRVFERQ
jgi:hypothetical protein